MKEQYIKLRNSGKLNWEMLYTYAVDRGMTMNPQMFMYGAQFLNMEQVIEQLDSEFELTRLHGKDGNFIKILE